MTLKAFLFFLFIQHPLSEQFQKTPKTLHPKIGNFEFKSGSYMHTSTNTLFLNRRNVSAWFEYERGQSWFWHWHTDKLQTPAHLTLEIKTKLCKWNFTTEDESTTILISHLTNDCCLCLGSNPFRLGNIRTSKLLIRPSVFPLSLTSKQAHTGCELQVCGPSWALVLVFVLSSKTRLGLGLDRVFTKAHLRVHLWG